MIRTILRYMKFTIGTNGMIKTGECSRMKSLFEQIGGTYTLEEDGIYYPDLIFSEEEKTHYGKYGMARKTFLKQYKKDDILYCLWREN